MTQPVFSINPENASVVYGSLRIFEALARNGGMQVKGLFSVEAYKLCYGLLQVFVTFAPLDRESTSCNQLSALCFDRSVLFDRKPSRRKLALPRTDLFTENREYVLLGPSVRRGRESTDGTKISRPTLLWRWDSGEFQVSYMKTVAQSEIEAVTDESPALPIVWEDPAQGTLKLIRGKRNRYTVYHRLAVNPTSVETNEVMVTEQPFRTVREYFVAETVMNARLNALQSGAELQQIEKAYAKTPEMHEL